MRVLPPLALQSLGLIIATYGTFQTRAGSDIGIPLILIGLAVMAAATALLTVVIRRGR